MPAIVASDDAQAMSNGTHDASPAVELTTTMLFVTSTSMESSRQTPPMGSFVYAMPDRYNANEPISTTMYYSASSIDFATRIAKLLARKTGLPCYVGNSISLTSTLSGGSVEEELEAFKVVVEAVLRQIATRNHT